MRVKIKIKPEKLKDIKASSKEMFLGKFLILREEQELNIDKKLLESLQCRTWFDVTFLKSKKKEASEYLVDRVDKNEYF